MATIKEVTDNLVSDRIKERQKARLDIESVFSKDRVVANFHIENGKVNPALWCGVYTQLMRSVLLEKDSWVKATTGKNSGKSTTTNAAATRLTQASRTVRWLIERASRNFTNKNVKDVVQEILKTLVYRRQLLQPLALNYIVTLQSILKWKPHLQHLSRELWSDLVQLCFNVVLGDPLTKDFEQDEDDVAQDPTPSVVSDDGMYADDTGQEEEYEETDSPSKKRRRKLVVDKAPTKARPKPPSHPTPSSSSRSATTISDEQILLTSLLATLLSSPNAPILDPRFTLPILDRLERFLVLYPRDTTLHHDYIIALSVTLAQLALNKRRRVESFARHSWDSLVGLWGTKNKQLKEGLVVVLRTLFPFFVSTSISHTGACGWSDGVFRLWNLLDNEAESKWGGNGLCLDALRLEVTSNPADQRDACCSRTFRAGYQFDVEQALAWAILELQADCAEKLFQFSESVHHTPSGSLRTGSQRSDKRTRFENPIPSLLSSIRTQSAPTHTRAHHLQTLLFIIERHWLVFHHALRQTVIATLSQLISCDDGAVQSWVFMCFAAIACADHHGPEDCNSMLNVSEDDDDWPMSTRDATTTSWDIIWTLALRRAIVPAVSRAACHAANVLLSYSWGPQPRGRKPIIPVHRVLSEIESFAKEIDVQGPTQLSDSVCRLLAHCLGAASQDARLHRMKLEDKAISWLVDSWRVSATRLALFSTRDVMLLLESMCSLSKRSDLVCRLPLPECVVVDAMVDEARTFVIHNYVMHSKIPAFRRPGDGSTVETVAESAETVYTEADLSPPQPRERKISAFILKSLEALTSEWESSSKALGSNSHISAERARNALDLAVVALSFEAVLVSNGTRSNRRVIQEACKLVSLATAPLADHRWTFGDKAVVLIGMEPLVSTGEEDFMEDEQRWEAMISADVGTGIKTTVLQSLCDDRETVIRKGTARRQSLQRIIWRSTDVQDAFRSVLSTLKNVLRILAGEAPVSSTTDAPMDVDDGFGPIRTTQTSMETIRAVTNTLSQRYIVEVAMAFLVNAPILQSNSGEPTRDKDLMDIVLDCNSDQFFPLAAVFLAHVRQGTLGFSSKSFESFILVLLEQWLQLYEFSKDDRLHLLLIHFLDSTLQIWTQPAFASSDAGFNQQQLCDWLSNGFTAERIVCWRVRDAFARFMDRYLHRDPTEAAWSEHKATRRKRLPSMIITSMSDDADIRVRFRGAVVNARRFQLCSQDVTPDELYLEMMASFPTETTAYESMLTRMLALANIIIASAAVRRGPYWHLLETALHTSEYCLQIETLLTAVSARMGLSNFSELFEAYAAQFALSIQRSHTDFFSYPPHLLGYKTRKEAAQATFRAFTASNIISGTGTPHFQKHCNVLGKTYQAGIRECFGDIAGLFIVSYFADTSTDHVTPDQLLPTMMQATAIEDEEEFSQIASACSDEIVYALLRTLGEQDVSPNSSIMEAFADYSGGAAPAFLEMVKYRSLCKFPLHEPNLPLHYPEAISISLSWILRYFVHSQTSATVYHVLHHLFADVHRSPLVNEQLRLVNAITMWIAFRASSFVERSLLQTVVHGASILLAEYDLARAAQGILEWAFDRYTSSSFSDPQCSNMLVQIACIVYNYRVSTNPDMANIGKDLTLWLDNQALKLSQARKLGPFVAKALSIWPYEPSEELANACGVLLDRTPSEILSDSTITSNKFRLVQQLRNHAQCHDYDAETFFSTDFWQLKECMPLPEQLQPEDIDAFVELLTLSQGRLRGSGKDQVDDQSIRHLHAHPHHKARAVMEKRVPNVRFALICCVHAMLRSNDPSRVHVAYKTLRLMLSAPDGPNQVFVETWPSNITAEVKFFQAHKCTPQTREARALQELSMDTFVESPANFARWISLITVLISEILCIHDPIFAQLTLLLESQVDFAEQVLPVLVHQLVLQDPSSRPLLREYFLSILISDGAAVASKRCIVDVALHLRQFIHYGPDGSKNPLSPDGTPWILMYDKWLFHDSQDFYLLARNALTYGAFTTALLFLEISAEYRDRSGTDNDSLLTEKVLLEIYSHIDEPDGFYGIQTKDMHQFLIKRLHHENQWDKAFHFHGAAFEAGNMADIETEGLLHSFHSFGFHHLAMDSLQNSVMRSDADVGTSSMMYHLGWRTEDWDLPDQPTERNSGASLYRAARALHRGRDSDTVDTAIRRALLEEMHRFRNTGAENLVEMRDSARSLMCIAEILQWQQPDVQHRLAVKVTDTQTWDYLSHIDSKFEFQTLEHIMATRLSLVRSARKKEERYQIGNLQTPFVLALIEAEKRCLVRLSEAARDGKHLQIALNSVVRAQRLENKPSFNVTQEFANILSVQKEHKLAVQFLTGLVADAQDATAARSSQVNDLDMALLLSRLGTWTSAARLEKPTVIFSTYFDKAATLAGIVQSNLPDNADPRRAKVYHQCATFAEGQYQTIMLQDVEASRWQLYADRKIQEVHEYDLILARGNGPNYADARRNKPKAQIELISDLEKIKRHTQARDSFLAQAIEMYSRCLESSDYFDDNDPIRLCSLWFSNFNKPALQDTIGHALERVASAKFVFLAHQLSARMAHQGLEQLPQNQANLQALVYRMCREHPFHSLYQVYCLKPDGPAAPTNRRQSSRNLSPQSEREAAAGVLFEQLRNDPQQTRRVQEVESVCDASLGWAKQPIKSYVNGLIEKAKKEPNAPNLKKFPIFKDQTILKIMNTKTPVLTIHTPIDKTMQYDNCVFIAGFEDTFTTAGGINLPKINNCVGSDGQLYKQLFKGEGSDDLRQDAVMEQVFDIVNHMLRHDRETSRRSLTVRDYKVIPLSSTAGVLEFVANTTPLSDWGQKAHQRYRPTDPSSGTVMTELKKKATECGRNPNIMADVLLEIYKTFKPVLRHYFTEKNKLPVSWYTMRLGYTRSVATNSIVGHVLGLGDRHGGNILLHAQTGEVINIDLGIAFDQGKLLAVPERVPFRMTRDIIDGMGISGTQGVFQRCAEECLRVLRDRSDVIMTILEVFKYDPLHSWMASDKKLRKIQPPSSMPPTNDSGRSAMAPDMTNAQEAAERALGSVSLKLDRSLSVEYTVNDLVAQATDPMNLGTIFPGWGPHM